MEIGNCKTLAILGPSGGGKSTLLRLIGGLEIPDSGEIFLDDKKIIFKEKELLHHRRSLGMVFQSFNLFPHLTALENIELPLHRVHGMSLADARDASLQLLRRFGLREHAYKKPSQLSGGQRQRVAIVRAVGIKARLILLDEPTSALDPLMTSEVLDLVQELEKEGRDIILASHHMTFVKKAADWVAFLADGRILEYGPTQRFFSSPKSAQARQFLEKVLKY